MENTINLNFIYKITFAVAVGGLLFGYDTAVVAGAVGFLEIHFDLSPLMVGWVASCALTGCIAGAAFGGRLSDRIGRRKVLMLSAILFALSSAGTAIPEQLGVFVAFRILGGIGIGIAAVLSPMYIAEIAPPGIRGRLVSINQLGIVTGILLIYLVNAIIAGMHDEQWNISTGWRWMFGSGLLPSLVFMLLLCFVPESPRWLIKKGRDEEALRILKKIGSEIPVDEQLRQIRQSISLRPAAFSELLKPALRKPFAIGIGLAILSQVTGINAIMYYAPEIFKATGDGPGSALLQTVLVGLINLLFTVVAIKYSDKLGRKALLMAGSAGMCICLLMIGAAFHLDLLKGFMVLAFILIYIACFALSLGPLTFVVISEIFPNKIRGTAMSVCIFILWVAVFAVAQSFPVLLRSIGSAYTFWFFMVMAFTAFIFSWKILPETKGKSLEAIEASWE